MDVTASSYVATVDEVRAMLAAGAVDVQQADLTRCGGATAFFRAVTLCDAFYIGLSGPCAPAIHFHAASRLRHHEWFHDHVRFAAVVFDGAPVSMDGAVSPDLSRPGHGLIFRTAEARGFRLS